MAILCLERLNKNQRDKSCCAPNYNATVRYKSQQGKPTTALMYNHSHPCCPHILHLICY